MLAGNVHLPAHTQPTKKLALPFPWYCPTLAEQRLLLLLRRLLLVHACKRLMQDASWKQHRCLT
jgi:hypothetical protein